jgi:Rap1a immunity proteins
MCMLKIAATICLGFLLTSYAVGRARSEPADLAGQNVFFTGNDIHSWCQHDKSMAEAYTAGLWDGTVRSAFVLDSSFRGLSHDAAVDFALKRLGEFCGPKGMTVAQVTDVFCAYIRDTPQSRHVHAALIFSEAMNNAWPCKKP